MRREALLDTPDSAHGVWGPVRDTPKRSLRYNRPWAVGGEAVYAASQWLLVVVLAKLGTPEMVGQFALAFAVTAPLILFANLQLRALLASDGRRDSKFSHYFTLRLLTSAL